MSLNDLNNLHPTQFCYGPSGYNYKISLITSKHSKNNLQKYLDKKPVPVIEYNNTLYLVDRHHLCKALLYQRKSLPQDIYVTIIKINTPIFNNKQEFIEYLIKNKLTLLEDKGVSKNFDQLPQSLDHLSVDWHRGLAWLVRKSGAILKTPVPFMEFYWANYLRPYIKEQPINDQIILKAIELSLENNTTTNNLPGFNTLAQKPLEHLSNLKKQNLA